MDEFRQQKLWTQLTEDLFCGNCKAGQLLLWDRSEAGREQLDAPRDAVQGNDHWYAVHCDFFKRRIENPNRLVRCRAHRKRGDAPAGERKDD